MDWKWSKEEDDFRQEVRDYLKAELPPGWGKEIFYDQDDDEQFRFAHEFTKKLAQAWMAGGLLAEGFGWTRLAILETSHLLRRNGLRRSPDRGHQCRSLPWPDHYVVWH